jgi:cellulose biosynthesis protein BcsQ
MLGRTQNVTLPTSLASRKLLRVSITMMQLQRNEKDKKHHREAPVIIKYVEDRFSERSKKKKKEEQHHERNFSWVKSAMKQGTILKSSSRYSI